MESSVEKWEKVSNFDPYYYLAKMITFIGDTLCKIDDKGRLLLPAAFKKQLGTTEPEVRFVVKKSIFKNCLEIYPIQEWESLIARIRKKINPFNKKHNEFLTQFHRGTAEMELDSSNRLLFPKRLLEQVGAEKEVVLTGVGGFIELWDKAVYDGQAMSDDVFESLAEEIMGSDFTLDE